jgi:N-acetylneuraminate synthase
MVKKWGRGEPLIVAEISCNHMGDEELAHELVEAAAMATADAVKFQLFSPGSMAAPLGSEDHVLSSGPWAGLSLWELYERAETPVEWLPALYERARALNLIPFSSVFDPADIPILESLNNPIYKIASPEAEVHDLVNACLDTGKPVFISEGVTTIWRNQGGVTSMACVSQYPAMPDAYGFKHHKDLTSPWGLSDHSRDVSVWCAAAALGAEVIEAHLMLDKREDYTPFDFGHSLTVNEFGMLARAARTAAGLGVFVPRKPDIEFRRRWCASRSLNKGDSLRDNVVALRCRDGMPASADPSEFKASQDIPVFSPIKYGMFE